MTAHEQRHPRPGPLAPTAQWPPEVPPFRPSPGVPPEPSRPQPAPGLPGRLEPDRGAFERDIANRLLDERIVTLSGRLDEEAANRVTSQLILLGRGESHRPITLHLSCSDSELGPSLALSDAVELTPGPVNAVVHGILRGPAVAVLCAATGRAAHRHTLFYLSVPPVTGEGTAAQLADLAAVHERQVEQLRRRITDVTGQQAENVEADLDYGRLLSAEEAKGYGLVQEIL